MADGVYLKYRERSSRTRFNLLFTQSVSELLKISLQDIGVNTTQDNKEVVANSDLVVIAVKPNVVNRVLQEIAPVVRPQRQLFVSIAAGVTIRAIEQVSLIHVNEHFFVLNIDLT